MKNICIFNPLWNIKLNSPKRMWPWNLPNCRVYSNNITFYTYESRCRQNLEWRKKRAEINKKKFIEIREIKCRKIRQSWVGWSLVVTPGICRRWDDEEWRPAGTIRSPRFIRILTARDPFFPTGVNRWD